jgi:hypothetical protein
MTTLGLDTHGTNPPTKRFEFTDWVILANLLGVVAIFLFAAFTHGAVTECLDGNHPVKIVLLFSMVLSVVWATERMVMRDRYSNRRKVLWIILSVVIWIGIGSLILFQYMGTDLKGNSRIAAIAILILFAFLILMSLLPRRVPTAGNFTPNTTGDADNQGGTGTEGGEDDPFDIKSIKRWGEAVVLVILMLAMFFLAINLKEGKFEVKWDEIPAILMVFLLAELGVSLVVVSMGVRRKVSEAAAIAHEALEKAQEVSEKVKAVNDASNETLQYSKTALETSETTLLGVNASTNQTLNNLNSSVEKITTLAEMDLWRHSGPQFSNKVGLDEKGLWKNLDQFMKDWTPTQSKDQGKHHLVKVLFECFIGESDTGNVRSTESAVSCVTLDSVFADASAVWLEAMAEEVANRNEKLVVWAITSLLPTDFALPSIWWSDTDVADADNLPRRTNTLEKFISSVIRGCAGETVGEYRRITVFQRNGSASFKTGFAESEELKKSFAHTLNNWLIWDPRVQGAELDWDQVQYWSAEIAEKVGKLRGDEQKPDTRLRKLSWNLLKELYTDSKGTREATEATSLDMDKFRQNRILPEFSGPGASNFYLFHNDFAWEEDEQTTGGVIAACDAFLGEVIRGDQLQKSGVDLELRKFLAAQIDKDELSLREVYTKLGWSSLGEWYCKYLHKGTENKADGAWWTELKEEQFEEAKFLEPLKLDWGGYQVLTLDLLLIGTMSNNLNDKSPHWHGAAISNISFDRTECTVQMVTNSERLEKIADAVKDLCGDFGQQPADKVDGHCNTWRNWPSPISSPTDEAEANQKQRGAGI